MTEYGIANPIHYLWLLLLAVPLIKGPEMLSVDYVISKWLKSR